MPKAGFVSFVVCKISQKLNQFNFLLQRYQLVSSDTKSEIDYLVIVALGVIDWLIDLIIYLFIYLFICLFIVICLFVLCWRKLFYNKFNYTYIKLRYAILSLRCTNKYKIKNIKIYKYPFMILWPSYFSMSLCTNNKPRNHQLTSQWIRGEADLAQLQHQMEFFMIIINVWKPLTSIKKMLHPGIPISDSVNINYLISKYAIKYRKTAKTSRENIHIFGPRYEILSLPHTQSWSKVL